MLILVDTTIWSLALRRQRDALEPVEQRAVDEWERLVQKDRACIIGPIRQEVLSGIRSAPQFEKLRVLLSDFDDHPIISPDYERAAILYNSCRSAGIAGSHNDLLICAVAMRLEMPIFSRDPDFQNYSACVEIRLHVY